MKSQNSITPETLLETLSFSRVGKFSYISCNFVYRGTKYTFNLNVDFWVSGQKEVTVWTQRLSLSRSAMTNRVMTGQEITEKWGWGAMVYAALEFTFNYQAEKAGVRAPSDN